MVHAHTTVAAAGGREHLDVIELQDTTSGERTRVPTYALFVFIGASPRSEWLEGTVERDDRGFVLTGVDYQGALPELVAPAPAVPTRDTGPGCLRRG